MTEEPDPEAVSPTNGSSMPTSTPVLTGPHLLDMTNPGEAASSPAASQSMKQIPASSRSASAQPAVPRSASNTKTAKPNKTMQKPLTSSMNQPSTSYQQTLDEQDDSTQAFKDDLLNLTAAMKSKTMDDESQASMLSQAEGREDQYVARIECEESEFNTIFWDIEVVKDLSIWAEPITMVTEQIFRTFNLAADEDILMLLGVMDRALPG